MAFDIRWFIMQGKWAVFPQHDQYEETRSWVCRLDERNCVLLSRCSCKSFIMSYWWLIVNFYPTHWNCRDNVFCQALTARPQWPYPCCCHCIYQYWERDRCVVVILVLSDYQLHIKKFGKHFTEHQCSACLAADFASSCATSPPQKKKRTKEGPTICYTPEIRWPLAV